MNIFRLARLFTLLLAATLVCGAAYASCTWETKCSGACQRVPVCDNISDFAQPKNTRNNMLLHRGGTHPSASAGCHQQKVCTKLGNCNYVNICNQ